MSLDPLSDVVRSLRLSGGVFLDGRFSAPWAIGSKVSEEDCRPFLPIPNHVIAYHVVTEGEMLVTLGGGTPQTARAGDIVFLPSNAWHVLASGPEIEPLPGDDLVLPASGDGLARICLDGGGARTHILCGFIASEAGTGPLFETLPETIIVSIEDRATLRWLESSIAMAARELTAGRISSMSVMSRLTELLLVEALRAYLETGAATSGWAAGMADPGIARALARIHTSAPVPPKTDDLAAVAGMSRTAFIQRFTQLLGSAPGRYALRLRMTDAEILLSETRFTTAEVAYRTGYDAPEAFSRAFKREHGVSPAEWRASDQIRDDHTK